jgi:glycosyltransferase involved in cell wall biosynthesis
MSRKRRILFVCFADSSHSQAWLDLLKGSEFDVRVFASPVDYGGMYQPQPWSVTTYSVVRPSRRPNVGQVKWLLPNSWRLRLLTKWAQHRFALAERWLRRVVEQWKPDIVHTLRLNPEATFTWQALRHIPVNRRPKWVVSSWGSDLYVEANDPNIRQQIEETLRHCDGFISDCRRDVLLAEAAGLDPAKVALAEPAPTTGGLKLSEYAQASAASIEGRNLILVPKSFEGIYNKTLPILEAFRLAEDALDAHEIHLLMCSREVRTWLSRMPESLRKRCHSHDMLPHRDVVDLLRRARVMIATSLSDGTPNVMLEAMAAGALPLMSPLDSIQEWIEDGRNGLLAPALHPDRIALALRRALTDDELWSEARQVNWQIVSQRANRERIGRQVIDYYRSL